MSSNIQNLSELAHILGNNEATDKGIVQLFSLFKIPRLLAVYEHVKNKGIPVSSIILMLIMFRLRGKSIHSMQNARVKGMEVCDDNTYYRLMNNSLMNWRKLLMSFVKQFITIVRDRGEDNQGTKCFVLDDTDIEKTGKTIEFIGKIFNHVLHRSVLGFKMLALGFWDGKSFIATDFSLHREKGKKGNYGMKKKELRAQFSKKRQKRTPGYKRSCELDKNKNKVAISMIKRAVKNGLIASYVLMDSWFTNDYMIKSIREIKKGAMHVLGMCRIDRRKYCVEGKEMNSSQIIARYSRRRKRYSRKYKSHYFTLVADYKGEKVKLFYIKYGKAKKWSLLLSTDLSLKFVEAIELYQIRWTIEVFFKECKQYLGLGTCQNTDFDGQVADITVALITHTLLTLQRRFGAYETMGELFREIQQHLIELNLWERILKIFIKMLQSLMNILKIDLEETLGQIFQDDSTAYQIIIIIKTLDENFDNDHENTKNAA